MTSIIAKAMMSGIIATSRDWAKNLRELGSLLVANSLTHRKAIKATTATNPSAILRLAPEAVTLLIMTVVIIFL